MSVIGSSDVIGRAPGGRKLIAVVYADMVGYSRLIGLDDLGTLYRLRTLRTTLIDPAISEHGGRTVQTAGDSLLIVFDSIDGAVRFAVSMQRQMLHHDDNHPPDRAIRFRIGINIGDVIADGTDLHGDGVNVAARLQAECPPGGICVSRAVRDHVHDRLDLVFDRLGELSLKNIARPVEAFVLRLRPETSGPKPLSPGSLPDANVRMSKLPRLSVLVAPFRNLGVVEQHEHLVEGLSEDFTADLSQLLGSFVVGGAEALRRNSQSASARDLARELGVAYVIQGSIRGTAGRIGVSVQLIDTESGAHLWAERLYVDLGGVADVRDEIVGRLVHGLSLRLIEDVNRRIEVVPPQDWTPYDLAIRGRGFNNRPPSKSNRQEAIRCFEQALDGDPASVDAKIGIAFVLIANVADGWSQSAEQDLARAERLLLDVLHDDGNVLYAHTWMGLLRRLQGRLDESQIEFETALEMAPNHAATLGQLGVTLCLLGQPEAAIPLIERSIRLAPHHPVAPLSYGFLGTCYLLLNNIEDAIICLKKSRAGNPRLYFSHLNLAAGFGLKGELREAAAALQQAIEIRPEIDSLSALRAWPSFTNPKFMALFEKTICAGLRQAGLPDE
jgi:class 3 adenylate cyclase/TolB-like protein/Flp pilus assembly protein TadD